MSKLAGKVAVVTGASKGIGAGIATALAAEGASVVVNYASSKAGADVVVDRITQAGGKAIAVKADVSEHFHRHFDINVLGLLLTTKAAARHLGEGGSVINIGSIVSHITMPETAVYTATKGAVDAITGVLSRELGPRGIRVNSINPGMVETEGSREAGVIGSDFQHGIVAQTPLGRIGQPDDIAGVAVFLASDDARWMSGEQLKVAGGLR